MGGVGAGKNPGLATSFGRPAGKAPQYKSHFTALSETVPPPIRPIYHLGQVPPKAWSAGITRAKSPRVYAFEGMDASTLRRLWGVILAEHRVFKRGCRKYRACVAPVMPGAQEISRGE